MLGAAADLAGTPQMPSSLANLGLSGWPNINLFPHSQRQHCIKQTALEVSDQSQESLASRLAAGWAGGLR